MKHARQILALILTLALFLLPFGNIGLAETSGGASGDDAYSGAGQAAFMPLLTDGAAPGSWAQEAKRVASLLGYIEEDAADIDLAAHAELISGLSIHDDSLYLAILAENGYLDGLAAPIDPRATIESADYEQLLANAFPVLLDTQDKADAQSLALDNPNIAAIGGDLALSAFDAGRIALIGDRVTTLTGIKAASASLFNTDETYLKGTELTRAIIERTDGEPTYLHVDAQTSLSEIIVLTSGDVILEGNGSLGTVRVMGDAGTVTIRATGSLSNETDGEIVVIGPDGEPRTVAAGAIADFVLEHYVVSFVTDGTPVETRLVAPGELLDFESISTEKDGAVFTAWYQDAEYTAPYSTLSPVDGELTLYARFMDAADALTVTFETFDGRALAPLIFAKGESLLTKPVSGIYTSKDGYTFSGWTMDEAGTQPFGYSEPIEESMTLYALFASNEQVQEEETSNVDQSNELDWQGEILLTVPEGVTLTDLSSLVTVEPGVGAMDPVLSFRETDAGYAVYGAYYETNGQTGFEPGASFAITASGGVTFAGYDGAVTTLTVFVYREQVEIVEFAEGLEYVLWDHVESYEPVVAVEDETVLNTGTMVVTGVDAFEEGEIVVFFDGEINDDEMTMGLWDGGAFDGYVLFAEIVECAKTGDDLSVTYAYADPAEYIAALDLHTSRDVDMESALTEDQLARMEDDLAAQIASNDELRAQMLVAVMTSQQSQDKLDELYGEGAYQLAKVKASLGSPSLDVKLSASRNTVTVAITVGVSVTLKDDGETLITFTPKLFFEEILYVSVDIDGGFLWVDLGLTLESTTTIQLTVGALTDKDSDTSVLATAQETLEEIAKAECLDETMDYMAKIDTLMKSMQSLVDSELSYNKIASIPCLDRKFGFMGIVSLHLEVEIIVEIGVLATFGVTIVAKQGEKIGFGFNFLKFSGKTYSQKLSNAVNTDIYLIGKLGVRIGPKITANADILSSASAEIVGGVYVYGELTGMLYFLADLVAGTNSFTGGLHLEVGIDAELDLELAVDTFFYKDSGHWTLMDERWRLFSQSWSDQMTLMDVDALDAMWAQAAADAGSKKSFGFAYVPMKTYNLFDGGSINNQLLWDSVGAGKYTLTLAIENLVIDGEAIAPEDPRSGIFYIGGGEKGGSAGQVYIDETIAAEYESELPECDVVITFENATGGALVKKQMHRFHLARSCAFSTTTVNVRFMLYDWCAHAWGIESAQWDNALVYETQFQSTHTLGGLYAPTETAEVDLAAIVEAARTGFPHMENVTYDWTRRTANGTTGLMQYSTPLVSGTCYLTPENSSIRYDVHAQTDEYTLTWYLYAYRFPGYTGAVNYIVKLLDPAADSQYAYSVKGRDSGAAMSFVESQAEENTWSLSTNRAQFNGTNQPLMMAVNENEAYPTGVSINGREPQETVVFEIKQGNSFLTIETGEGVAGYTVEPVEIISGSLVSPNTEIALKVEPEEGFRNIEMVSDPPGLAYIVNDDELTFTMPSYDVTVKLIAHPVNRVDFQYNHPGMDLYQTVYLAANETIMEPAAPSIDGMTFRGWYDNAECAGEPYVFGAPADAHLTLYADWTCDVTVDFGGAAGRAAYTGADGKSVLFFDEDDAEYARFSYSTQRVGDRQLEIVVQNRPDYHFKGWYLTADYSGDPVDLATYVLTGGITLYARWAKIVQMNYDLNYGDERDYFTAYADAGWPIEMVPESPARAHYQFSGWFTSAGCAENTRFNPKTEYATGDMTLYAGWIADEYEIEYHLTGGSSTGDNQVMYTVESEFTLSNPTRTGYTFTGWIGTGLTEPTMSVTIPAGSSGNREYTANWEAIVYKIKYTLVRGTLEVENPEDYTIESDEILLHNPEKEGYEFLGWTGTDLTEASTEVRIPKGSIGVREYTATWETLDPDFIIADNAIDAVEDTYRYLIDEYIDGNGETSSLYLDARADIVQNEKTQAYADSIALEVTRAPGDSIQSDVDHTYTYSVKITYTNVDDDEIVREKDITVVVAKRVAEPQPLPAAESLLYGHSLEDSALSDGVMKYNEEEVTGTFAWVDDTIVPLAKNNGDVMYSVLFTPDPAFASLYATVEMKVAVTTQFGVRVKDITAESRDYIYDNVLTKGTYKLYDADEDNLLLYENEGLAVGVGAYEFSQYEADDEPLTVTFSGYALDEDYFDSEQYALVGEAPTAEAYIYWIEPELDVDKDNIDTVTYDDTLSAGMIQGARALYDTEELGGTWGLTLYQGEGQPDGTTVNTVGATELKVTFIPEDDKGYKTVSTIVTVDVQRKAIEEPTSGFEDRPYTGQPQTYAGDDTAYYTVAANGGTDVSTYPVVFELRNIEYCYWSQDDTRAKETYENSFKIVQASLTVTGDATVIALGYGQEIKGGTDVIMSERNTDMKWKLPIGDMLRDNTLEVKFFMESTPGLGKWEDIPGHWEWDLTSLGSLTQPLDVKDGGYPDIQAIYVFEDETDAKNFIQPSKTFTVVVNKQKPYVENVGLSASEMLQSPTNTRLITNSILSVTTGFAAQNPFTGTSIEGTWKWLDESIKPVYGETNQYMASFVPSGDARNHYTDEATKAVSVTAKKKVKVKATLMFKGSISYSIVREVKINGVTVHTGTDSSLEKDFEIGFGDTFYINFIFHVWPGANWGGTYESKSYIGNNPTVQFTMINQGTFEHSMQTTFTDGLYTGDFVWTVFANGGTDPSPGGAQIPFRMNAYTPGNGTESVTEPES